MGNKISLFFRQVFYAPLPSARSSAYVTESASLPIPVYLVLDFFHSYLLLIKWYFSRAKQPRIIVVWRATYLKPVSLKSISLNRGHHLSWQVPLSLRWKSRAWVGPGDKQREWYSFACVTNPIWYLYTQYHCLINPIPVPCSSSLPPTAHCCTASTYCRCPELLWRFVAYCRHITFFLFAKTSTYDLPVYSSTVPEYL